MPYQIKNGKVYGSNAVSLTQAQYDALSTAEKNNGTVYYIYDSDDAVFDAEDVGLADGGNVQTLAGSVAIIETSPATATHAVGDYIVWNGQLYEVITAIAVGETLTVGTNITATTVGEELTSLNNELTFLENNPVILWKTSNRSNISHATGANYWTMPDSFPPKSGYSRIVVGVAVIDSTSSVLLSGWERQDNNVIIRTRNEGSATVTISLTATYIYLKDSAQF